MASPSPVLIPVLYCKMQKEFVSGGASYTLNPTGADMKLGCSALALSVVEDKSKNWGEEGKKQCSSNSA